MDSDSQALLTEIQQTQQLWDTITNAITLMPNVIANNHNKALHDILLFLNELLTLVKSVWILARISPIHPELYNPFIERINTALTQIEQFNTTVNNGSIADEISTIRKFINIIVMLVQRGRSADDTGDGEKGGGSDDGIAGTGDSAQGQGNEGETGQQMRTLANLIIKVREDIKTNWETSKNDLLLIDKFRREYHAIGDPVRDEIVRTIALYNKYTDAAERYAAFSLNINLNKIHEGLERLERTKGPLREIDAIVVRNGKETIEKRWSRYYLYFTKIIQELEKGDYNFAHKEDLVNQLKTEVNNYRNLFNTKFVERYDNGRYHFDISSEMLNSFNNGIRWHVAQAEKMKELWGIMWRRTQERDANTVAKLNNEIGLQAKKILSSNEGDRHFLKAFAYDNTDENHIEIDKTLTSIYLFFYQLHSIYDVIQNRVLNLLEDVLKVDNLPFMNDRLKYT